MSVSILNEHVKSKIREIVDIKHNAEKIMDNFQSINEYISGCDKCSDYEIVQPHLALTCDGENCNRQINDHAGVGIYYVDNNQ